MKQAAGGDGGVRREPTGRTSYLEGECDNWDEELSAGEAARQGEIYDDEPRGGYGFGDAPLGRFSSREHWGEPAPGRKDTSGRGGTGTREEDGKRG